MITNTTVEQIMSWPLVDGWHVDPETGTHIKLGDDVTLGDRVKLGDDVVANRNPISIHGTRYVVYEHGPDTIGVGCEIHTLEQWLAKWQEIGEHHGFVDHAPEYLSHIEHVAKVR